MSTLIIDVDTALGIEGGDIDDALMIAYLAGQSNWAGLAGISVVAGNVSLSSGVKSTLYICDLLGLDVPVFPGAAAPADRPLKTGHSLVMGNANSDEKWIFSHNPVREPETMSFGEWVGHQDPSFRFTLLATGPMTNVADLLLNHPSCKYQIEQIVSMGGWFFGEERHPEFNMMVDPPAVSTVFQSGIPLTIVPLEMTLKTCLMPDDIVQWLNYGEVGQAFHDGTLSWMSQMKSIRGQEGCHLHDPLAAVALLHPEIIETVGIIPSIDLETGKTDVLSEDPHSVVRVVRSFDNAKFQELLLKGIGVAFETASRPALLE